MRHQHMARIAAIRRDAEMARRGAQFFVAVPTRRTGAAADPGIYRNLAPAAADASAATSGPAASIVPAISWPSVNGSDRPAVISSRLSPASLK